jgi:hypothetical protein
MARFVFFSRQMRATLETAKEKSSTHSGEALVSPRDRFVPKQGCFIATSGEPRNGGETQSD